MPADASTRAASFGGQIVSAGEVSRRAVSRLLGIDTLGAPYVVITVSATLVGFDQNLVRAGASLGAGPIRVFFVVTLPIILPGVVSGALFAFAASWDELVVVMFLASTEQHTVPRRMWSGIRELISPTITAAATMLIILSICLMATMEGLRRRSERIRGITHRKE